MLKACHASYPKKNVPLLNSHHFKDFERRWVLFPKTEPNTQDVSRWAETINGACLIDLQCNKQMTLVLLISWSHVLITDGYAKPLARQVYLLRRGGKNLWGLEDRMGLWSSSTTTTTTTTTRTRRTTKKKQLENEKGKRHQQKHHEDKGGGKETKAAPNQMFATARSPGTFRICFLQSPLLPGMRLVVLLRPLQQLKRLLHSTDSTHW